MGNAKAFAFQIIDVFENLLDKHKIYIPDECREENASEACIYGMTYRDLEDKVINILEEYARCIDEYI